MHGVCSLWGLMGTEESRGGGIRPTCASVGQFQARFPKVPGMGLTPDTGLLSSPFPPSFLLFFSTHLLNSHISARCVCAERNEILLVSRSWKYFPERGREGVPADLPTVQSGVLYRQSSPPPGVTFTHGSLFSPLDSFHLYLKSPSTTLPHTDTFTPLHFPLCYF